MPRTTRTHLSPSPSRRPRKNGGGKSIGRVQEIYAEDVRPLDLGGKFVRLELRDAADMPIAHLVLLPAKAEKVRDALTQHLEKIQGKSSEH